jgi:hypothetical protein
MPAIYFGRKPTARGAGAKSVSTPRGDLVPVAPSEFRIFTNRHVTNPGLSILFSLFGHVITVLSYPIGFFLPLSSPGFKFRAPDTQIVFYPRPGLGFRLSKGHSPPTSVVEQLEAKMFRSLLFGDGMVWYG